MSTSYMPSFSLLAGYNSLPLLAPRAPCPSPSPLPGILLAHACLQQTPSLTLQSLAPTPPSRPSLTDIFQIHPLLCPRFCQIVPVISDADPKFNNEKPMFFERLYEPFMQPGKRQQP